MEILTIRKTTITLITIQMKKVSLMTSIEHNVTNTFSKIDFLTKYCEIYYKTRPDKMLYQFAVKKNAFIFNNPFLC